MKILYYNWIQFDNAKGIGGGVNVYLRNLIGYLSGHSDDEIYFLSSGWKYNPLRHEAYIRETKNIYGNRCRTYEIINSSIMSPAYFVYMYPQKLIEDTATCEMLDSFIAEHGPFDVIHFQTIEGISVNCLKLKGKYPNTEFVVSIHNYQPICPLVQYFQNHRNCICDDFHEGNECLSCSLHRPGKKEYYRHVRNYYDEIFRGVKKIFKPAIKLMMNFFNGRNRYYIGSETTMLPEQYVRYRRHNIEMLNRYADVVLAVSERVRKIMIQHGLSPHKIRTSYIGTKIAENELGHSVAEETHPFTIAYMGYARYDKGYFFFVDALSQLEKRLASKINVVLAVAGIREEDYKQKLASFNRVITYNGYTHDKLPQILHDVNLGVVPVLWEDNLPQVAIEMVACGVPVLCSSFGGASELCQSDLFKFDGGDEESFLSKLTTLLNKPELLAEYWKCHPKLTTMEKHVEELLRFYVQR